MSNKAGTKIGVISLGCSKNRVNSEQMMFLLREAGYYVTGETDEVDFVLLNTCGFIESAKTEAVETILELSAAKKDGRIGKLIVAGCLPERHKEDILEELPEIDAVVGTGSFDDIVEVVKNVANNSDICLFGDIDAPVSETPRIISTSPLWAYLKIAEGCDNRCAYCCIPDIRGRFRSRPMENIIEEAETLVKNGVRELIIVAQDVTRYGFDIYGELKLAELLTKLDKIKELKWIRLHYLYPDGFSEELIDVIAKSGKILKYLDIPIQHINDSILEKMNRRSSGADIRVLIKTLRERIEGVVLRTSLITGLPGEGEQEFSELLEFIREYKIERVGVFAYSPEDGTPAALMSRPSKKIAEERAELLLDLQSDIVQEFNNSRVDLELPVLIDGLGSEIDNTINGREYLLARSYAESPDIDGYIYIKTCQKNRPPDRISPDRFADIRITGIEDGVLVGEQI